MKPLRAIQYKALFLLITFSMNTVVGFACSLGVDMGFNSKHHSHAGGKQHEDSEADHHDEHDGNSSHGHQHEAISHHHSESDNDTNTVSFTSQDEENCCKDYIVGFNSLDKLLVKQNSTQQKIAWLSPFIISAFISEANNAKGYVQHLRIPPREIDYSPPDIRVFIQSFLI
jgi:ABC-type Zn2+ transport system substrate-binding protein/surface adhesin